MATLILVRHGRTTANASGLLAGRTPGVELDEAGHEQVRRTAERLAPVRLDAVVTSPLERCRQTAASLVEHRQGKPSVVVDDRLNECDYGDWQNRPLADLAREDLWETVQRHPSAAVFPGGESMPAMQARAVPAVRELDARFHAEYGEGAIWVAVSHGDVIKSLLADALGMHLDLFQRLSVNPASVSVVRYGPHRPDVVCVNTDAGDLSWLASSPPPADATPGGGAGPAPSVVE